MEMRPIDADALKFRDVKVQTNEIDIFGFGGYLVEECKGILQEEIWNAPTIDTEPHWIPCEEKLPEIGQPVLCQCLGGIIDVLWLAKGKVWRDLHPHIYYMGWFVIAWMPLPRPYTERKDNG